MNTEKIIAIMGEVFAGRPEVVFAYLYGSHARGTANKLSDVDIAVYLDEELVPEEKWFDRRLDLMVEVMSVLKMEEVDLVVLNKSNPLLAHEVLKYGILLVCRDEPARIEFAVRTTNRYMDWKRMKAPFFEAMIKRIKEGRFGKAS